ncbi:hypothetical protein [Salinispora arenicola]|uniref:hypothetical protein n=1 Tax=Salinispora arenicola TaxID=168697 RepID=UPI0027DE6B71|nr:hypothetical protein [Salinispora arenicola]
MVFTAALIEAVEAGRQISTARVPPPRSDDAESAPEAAADIADDVEILRAIAERLLADANSVSVVDVLDDAGDWKSARRVLAEVTAIHHHPELDYELVWRERVRIDVAASPSRTSQALPARQPGGRGGGMNESETALWWARIRAAGPQRVAPSSAFPAGMLRLVEPRRHGGMAADSGSRRRETQRVGRVGVACARR